MSSQLIKKLRLGAIALNIGALVASTTTTAIAQDHIDNNILEIVKEVKKYPIWPGDDTTFVKINEDPYIRIVYRDNSSLGKVPDNKVGLEDTITISFRSYRKYMVRLDLSNIPPEEREEFLRIINEIRRYIINAPTGLYNFSMLLGHIYLHIATTGRI